MWQFSDNPRACITEVEIFCGFILNKRGSQTRRQRDSSIKLREEMDRIIDWVVNLIRDRGNSSRQEDVVELCWACVMVDFTKDPNMAEAYHGMGELKSFRIVVAYCLLREMDRLAKVVAEREGEGGGFVGVGAGQVTQTTLLVC